MNAFRKTPHQARVFEVIAAMWGENERVRSIFTPKSDINGGSGKTSPER